MASEKRTRLASEDLYVGFKIQIGNGNFFRFSRKNFRIKPSQNVEEELDRLANIVSKEATKEVRKYMKEWRNGR